MTRAEATPEVYVSDPAVGQNGAVRLNLGAGDTELPGYIPIDRKLGMEAYPLDYEDGSVDEIRASHVLEHFSHRVVNDVLQHWVRKLKPGGRLRIAVPDFQWIARNYLAGEPINVQGYTMGGHVDGDDRHGAIFDDEALHEQLVAAGLERIGRWKSDTDDWAGQPGISLNMEGYKPSSEISRIDNALAILSCPRYGPTSHFASAYRAFLRIGLNYQIQVGAYWHILLHQYMEDILEDPKIEWVITTDYDTMFDRDSVLEMYRLCKQYPIDALCALQMKRASDHAILTVLGKDGKNRTQVYLVDWEQNCVEINTGHFGLTFLRAEKLRQMPRPWMIGVPNEDGSWNSNKGAIHPDIEFWLNWKKAGNKIHCASHIPVGHLQEVITWPSENLTPIHQYTIDYHNQGMPEGVRT